MIPKLCNKNNMINKTEDTMCLTFKVVVSHKFSPVLDLLYNKSIGVVNRMLKDRTKNSSKFYKEIPCVISKSLISKYQKNKKLKKVSSLVLPICGDKGKQVKITGNGLRIPALFKKDIIQVSFPKEIVGFIRQVEFFKKDKVWYMSYSYNTPKIKVEIKENNYIGVDRNSVGNVATISLPDKTVKFLGPDCSGLSKNFRNRRSKLQRKGAKNALKKIKRKQSNRTKDINHKVSRQIVNYAKEHCSAIVLEDLKHISKKGKAKRYVQKSQWSFYQLETFINYKAALLNIPVIYVNPAYTSQECYKCGKINKTTGKKYICGCGYVAHRDANSALILPCRVTQGDTRISSRFIDNPLNRTVDKAIESESSGGAR